MSEELAPALLSEAEHLLDEGNLHAAADRYRKILDDQPAHAEALVMLGSVLGEMGQLDEAARHLEKAMEAAPADARAPTILGRVRNALGQPQAALETLREAVRRAPDDAVSACTLGEMLQQQGDISGAIEQFERSIELDPSMDQVWSWLGYLYLQQDKIKLAENCYRKALEADSNNVPALAGWCTSITRFDYPPEAGKLLDKLLEQPPAIPDAAYHLALTAARLDRPEAASTCIDKALQAEPESHTYRIGKADILERAGNLRDCFEILKPYLEAQPASPAALLILSRFSHKVGLQAQCLQLIEAMLGNDQLESDMRVELSAAMDKVRHAKPEMDRQPGS